MRALLPGDVVNGYKIEDELGRGGMSVVFEAIQLSLERRVALKMMSVPWGDEGQFRLRFRREALIQASLVHPRIVTVHDAGEFEGMPYIVMRLIRGTTLKGLLADGDVGPAQLLNLIGQIAEALDAAHAQNLVHRDIKPQNILVRSGKKAYLADFGLTRVMTDERFTSPGQFVGTVQYVAPEQIIGLETTGAADIYALACVLYEGLTGSPPFTRDTEVAVLYAHTTDPAPRPSSVRPGLPTAIDPVLERGMAKDPADRYESAAAMVAAAQEALGTTTERL